MIIPTFSTRDIASPEGSLLVLYVQTRFSIALRGGPSRIIVFLYSRLRRTRTKCSLIDGVDEPTNPVVAVVVRTKYIE